MSLQWVTSLLLVNAAFILLSRLLLFLPLPHDLQYSNLSKWYVPSPIQPQSLTSPTPTASPCNHQSLCILLLLYLLNISYFLYPHYYYLSLSGNRHIMTRLYNSCIQCCLLVFYSATSDGLKYKSWHAAPMLKILQQPFYSFSSVTYSDRRRRMCTYFRK